MRIYVEAPTGPPLPYGLLSVADITDQNDGHWAYGGESEPFNCADVEFADNICDPVSGTNEVQSATITGAPTGGTYTLTVFGQTTAPIAHNASNATVQSALEALDAIAPGDITVTGTATARVFTWGGRYAAENVPQITATNVALTGGTSPAISTATTTQGVRASKTPWTYPGLAQYDPFTIYMLPQCAGMNGWKDVRKNIGRVFAGAEQRGVESGLWNRMTAAGAGVTVINATAQTVKRAVAEAEYWASQNYNTIPVLHAPRDLASLMTTDANVEPRGNVLKTRLGTPVAAGAGYAHTGPEGAAAVANEAWLFVTGLVTGTRGQMALHGPHMVAANDNTYRGLVERTYLLGNDCLLGAIKVALG